MSRTTLAVLLAFGCAAALAATDAGFGAVCPYDQQLCADYFAFGDRVLKTQTPEAAQLAAMNGEFIELVKRTEGLAYDQLGKWPLGPKEIQGVFGGLTQLRVKLNEESLVALPKEAANVSRDLLVVESEADGLQSDLRAPNADLQRLQDRLGMLDARAGALWERVRELGEDADRMGSPYKDRAEADKAEAPADKIAAPAELWMRQINPLEERVAALRDRLKLLQEKLGAFTQAGAAAGTAQTAQAQQASAGEEKQAGVSAADIAGKLRDKGLDRDVFDRKGAESLGDFGQQAASGRFAAVDLSAPRKTLIDTGRPPSVLRPTLRVGLDGGKFNADRLETVRIAMLKTAGVTKTVGDPGGRGRLAFLQTGGTCALAAQAQMYAETHGIPPTVENMKAIEDRFFENVRRRKMFTGNSADPGQRGTGPFGGGGTPDQYMGDLLDTPIKKHYGAKPQELETAVKTGKIVLISANAGLLWNDPKYKTGGHAIAVTGAEVNRLTGTVEGYYINDTGTGESARFVTAKQLLPAWSSRGGTFIEAL